MALLDITSDSNENNATMELPIKPNGIIVNISLDNLSKTEIELKIVTGNQTPVTYYSY